MSSQNFLNTLTPQFKQKTIFVVLWAIIACTLFLVRSVLLPFLLAALLAYVFQPVIALIDRFTVKGKKLPRIVGVLLIYLFFGGMIFIFCAFFVPRFYNEMLRLAKEASAFVNDIDEQTVTSWGQSLENFFRTYDLPFEIVSTSQPDALPQSSTRHSWISIDLFKISHELLNNTLMYLKSETKHIFSSAQFLFSKFISGIFLGMLVLMITGFLLVDVKLVKQFLFKLIAPSDCASFDRLLVRLDKRLSGVVRGQLMICVVNAFLTLIGLLIFNVNYAFILATVAGAFSIVPVFGSTISTIPIVIVALTTSPLTALCALLWIIGIHVIEANILNPKIIGDSAEIHPVLIILSLLVGEHYYGIIGALLAAPISSIFITFFLFLLEKARRMDPGVHKPHQS